MIADKESLFTRSYSSDENKNKKVTAIATVGRRFTTWSINLSNSAQNLRPQKIFQKWNILSLFLLYACNERETFFIKILTNSAKNGKSFLLLRFLLFLSILSNLHKPQSKEINYKKEYIPTFSFHRRNRKKGFNASRGELLLPSIHHNDKSAFAKALLRAHRCKRQSKRKGLISNRTSTFLPHDIEPYSTQLKVFSKFRHLKNTYPKRITRRKINIL